MSDMLKVSIEQDLENQENAKTEGEGDFDASHGIGF